MIALVILAGGPHGGSKAIDSGPFAPGIRTDNKDQAIYLVEDDCLDLITNHLSERGTPRTILTPEETWPYTYKLEDYLRNIEPHSFDIHKVIPCDTCVVTSFEW